MISRIKLVNNRSLAKNASFVCSTILNLGRCGPDSNFWVDLSATGAGKVNVDFQVGNSAGDTFYTPSTARTICSNHLGGAVASRDRYQAYVFGTELIKIKVKEQNASHMTITDLSFLIAR